MGLGPTRHGKPNVFKQYFCQVVKKYSGFSGRNRGTLCWLVQEMRKLVAPGYGVQCIIESNFCCSTHRNPKSWICCEVVDPLFFLLKRIASCRYVRNTFRGVVGVKSRRQSSQCNGFGPKRNTNVTLLALCLTRAAWSLRSFSRVAGHPRGRRATRSIARR